MTHELTELIINLILFYSTLGLGISIAQIIILAFFPIRSDPTLDAIMLRQFLRAQQDKLLFLSKELKEG